ncbi:hypothetical protein PoB_002557300 [Plakobranchus ocellatus]|uniref:Uncharacterized protein n=1 Tax=Plakobranchus ocellatus TaxID=259542 RepID=A0AAV3ZXD5_9GAST|nr:hypothetical protein PoB_002557300 [Plakobranchus ocellatus]
MERRREKDRHKAAGRRHEAVGGSGSGGRLQGAYGRMFWDRYSKPEHFCDYKTGNDTNLHLSSLPTWDRRSGDSRRTLGALETYGHVPVPPVRRENKSSACF